MRAIMTHLAFDPERLTVCRLAVDMGEYRPGVSRALRLLREEGYVEDDRLVLTPQGREQVPGTREHLWFALNAALAHSTLTDGSEQAAGSLLRALTERDVSG